MVPKDCVSLLDLKESSAFRFPFEKLPLEFEDLSQFLGSQRTQTKYQVQQYSLVTPSLGLR